MLLFWKLKKKKGRVATAGVYSGSQGAFARINVCLRWLWALQGDGLLFLVVVGSYVFSRLAISEKVVRTGQCGEQRARTREDEREARGELIFFLNNENRQQ